MSGDMSKDYTDASTEENSAISIYKGLMNAKKKEVDTLTARIEVEMTRVDELAVQIATATTTENVDVNSLLLSKDKGFLKIRGFY